MKSRELTLHQIWLIINGITLVTVLIFTFDPERMLPISLMRALMVTSAIALFTWGLLQLAISYANYQLRTAGVEELASANEKVSTDDLLPEKAGVGRPKDMVRIPMAEEQVHMSDDRVGMILVTFARGRQGDPVAQAQVAQWKISPNTLKRWRRRRRELGIVDSVEAGDE
jgi:hypothetical protein